MTPQRLKSLYSRILTRFGETVYIRRYSGTGAGRTSTDYAVKARVVEFRPEELIGGIVQGDRNIIALAEDIADSGITLPLRAGTDAAVVRGRELKIKAIDDNTRRVAGELVAYDIVVGG